MRYLYFLAGLLGDSSSLGISNNNLDNATLNRIIDLVFMIAGSVAVIIVIVAGINYALSLGDPAKTAKAKNAILYSSIGLIVVSSAFIIVKFIIVRFT